MSAKETADKRLIVVIDADDLDGMSILLKEIGDRIKSRVTVGSEAYCGGSYSYVVDESGPRDICDVSLRRMRAL